MSIKLDQLTSAVTIARAEYRRKFEAACVLCGVPADTKFTFFPPDVQAQLKKASGPWMNACRELTDERLRLEAAFEVAQARRKANLQAAAGLRPVGFARPQNS